MNKRTNKFNTLLSALTLLALSLQFLPLNAVAQKNLLSTSEDSNSVKQDFSTQIPEDDFQNKKKLSPDMEDSVGKMEMGFRRDKTQKVIITLKEDLDAESFSAARERKGIYMADRTESLTNDLVNKNGRLKKSFDRIGVISAELPLSQIKELAKNPNVAYISPDRPIASTGHIENVTGALQSRGLVSGTTLDGTGIGVAVLDSGIDTYHKLNDSNATHPGVVFTKNFTGVSATRDNYGHGTHVASIIAGDSPQSPFNSVSYRGVAPNAKLLNLRVLDQNGVGSVSNAIAAIDWAIANKAAYNIRVMNLSIGTPAIDSYKNDPLCLAARRAVNAGIVVVASAGNNGKDANGRKLYGLINSPGIEPSVITVGAANTFGTDSRSDDKVTTYSSRGPTRGYTTNAIGQKVFDNLIKPDLVAPGNKIITARAFSNSGTNNIVSENPSLEVNPTANSNVKLMYLSGTSMAAPMVSGTAALMIQANPNLTPNLVKAILMYSAQPIAGCNTFEQGAGLVNVDGAIRLSLLVKSNASTLANGGAMLTGALPNPQSSIIGGQTIKWGQGVVTNYGFLYGSNLMTKWQGMYGNGSLMSDATFVSIGLFKRSTSLTSTGVNVYGGSISNNGSLMSDGSLMADGVIMSIGTLMSDGSLMADGILMSDGSLMADGVIMSDTAFLGDNTPGMQPE